MKRREKGGAAEAENGGGMRGSAGPGWGLLLTLPQPWSGATRFARIACQMFGFARSKIFGFVSPCKSLGCCLSFYVLRVCRVTIRVCLFIKCVNVYRGLFACNGYVNSMFLISMLEVLACFASSMFVILACFGY